MMRFNKAIQRGLDMYRNRENYAYFYGAKGVILSTAVMDALIAAEPNYFKKYSPEEIAQIKHNSVGKVGYDCSGFTGHCTGDKQWSTGQINNCSKITTPAEGTEGSLLYTTFGGTGRHIGLDIGCGFCLDMGYESTDKNILLKRDSVRLTRISETAWEKSGQTKVMDYTGATNL